VKSVEEAPNGNREVQGMNVISKTDHLPSNIGAFFFDLRMFRVDDNNLKSLRRDNFRFMEALQGLFLYRNQITELSEDDIFNDLCNLEAINLSENKIKTLSKKLLSRQQKLVKFYISSNEIESFDRQFFASNKNLKEINFFDNKITSIHGDSFKTQKKLTRLRLGSNRLTQLPENVFDPAFNLEYLHVGHNQLKVLPKKLLWRLEKLSEFYAMDNQIEFIDPELFKNSKEMRTIQLEKNNLKVISADFTKVLKLRKLFLRENVCIDTEYKYPESLTVFTSLVNANCTS